MSWFAMILSASEVNNSVEYCPKVDGSNFSLCRKSKPHDLCCITAELELRHVTHPKCSAFLISPTLQPSVCLSVCLSVSVRFNSHYSRWICVSQYQNVSILDFVRAKVGGGGGGDNCKAPLKSPPPTNQHRVFLQAECLPVAQPTVSQHWTEVLHRNYLSVNCQDKLGSTGTRTSNRSRFYCSRRGWTWQWSQPKLWIIVQIITRPVFYRPDALPAIPPTVSKHWMQCMHTFILVLWNNILHRTSFVFTCSNKMTDIIGLTDTFFFLLHWHTT